MTGSVKKLLRVMLVTPPYHAGVVESAGRWPHLGFIYIAGAIRAVGHDVEIYDAMSLDHTLEEITQHIAEVAPDVVCASAKTPSLYAAVALLRAAKNVLPGVVTVLGGIHPTFCYEEVLHDFGDAVDFTVRGEGEITLCELLAWLDGRGARGLDMEDAGLGRILGLAYLANGKLVVNEPRCFMPDLDILQPAWDLVAWPEYRLHFIEGSRVATLSSSRGCTNECVFCSQQKFWQRNIRFRRPEKVIADIELLYSKYGVDYVMLTDEYPTKDRARWEAFLDGLIERHLPVHILMETCVSDILRDAEIMDKYRDAGVLHIYVGVEGTRQERLDTFKKNIECRHSQEAIRLINEAGMISECSFILGVPEETDESISDTLALARLYDPDYAHFLMLAPWPFADIYPDMEPYIETRDYSKYNLVEPVIKPIAMSRDQIFRRAIDCYRQFYMGKLPQWFGMADGFKRAYLIGSMKAMVERSFLAKFGAGLGEMPAEVEKYLGQMSGFEVAPRQ